MKRKKRKVESIKKEVCEKDGEGGGGGVEVK
jgi:hypothetical protein